MASGTDEKQRDKLVAALLIERFGPPPYTKAPDPAVIDRRRTLNRAMR